MGIVKHLEHKTPIHKIMNMSNQEGRTIPHGNGGDDELIDRLIVRLNALEEKEKNTVSIGKRALYVMFAVMAIVFGTTAALSISAHMRINQEEAISAKQSVILNKVSSIPEVLSDAEMEQVDEEFKELEMDATRADFSPAFWYGTSFKRQVWNPTFHWFVVAHRNILTIYVPPSIIFVHIRFEG